MDRYEYSSGKFERNTKNIDVKILSFKPFTVSCDKYFSNNKCRFKKLPQAMLCPSSRYHCFNEITWNYVCQKSQKYKIQECG